MKKITLVCFAIFSLLMIAEVYAQKVVVIGMNHISSSPNTDGFAFVATENIPVNDVIRFTTNEYDAAANVFTNNGAGVGEGVVTFTATSAITIGTVIFVNETGTSTDVFTVTCSGGGTCGTAIFNDPAGTSFSVPTNGDSVYAYSDTNDNPFDSIGQIFSVMFTGKGEAPIQNGGNIPANENPIGDFPNAVVVDGFPDDGDINVGPERVEFMFNPASLRDGVSQTGLENPNNYLSYAAPQALSIVPFTNLNLAGANPVLSVTVSPMQVNENSGTGMVYTFSLDAAAVGPITANFSVGGTATFTTDYTQTGATSFNASSGTVTIPNGGTTRTVTITPVGDATLEPDETAILTLTAGTGYDAGSPSAAMGTILNDDTSTITPVVAVTGGVFTNGGSAEGFSFVALDDITAGTQVYFNDYTFDNNLLRFSVSGSDAVILWTAPAGGVLRGEVIVATENSPNVFTATCSSGTCGTVSILSGTFDVPSNGEGIYAYSDNDANPTNGITNIYALLYTGDSAGPPGGNVPASQDPQPVYTNAVVVDGFPAVLPARTEYKFAGGERAITVDQANFQNTSNWLNGTAAATLNTTPFANIIIATGSANPSLSLTVSPTTTAEDSGTGMVYTFLLSAPAVGNITVNFDVAGTATFTTDYTQSGAASFNATSGTAVILNGTNSVAVTVTPVADAVVEPLETVQLMIDSGTGYDGGSPNAATGSITNDDTSDSDPLVAITGMNHVSPDGFSFVAAQDIPANTTIYFTENEFNNTTLLFDSGEGVFVYTSPGAVIPAGDVIVIKETATDVFSLTCNTNTGVACGSFALVANTLAHDTFGESLYAYKDSDNDPTNGVDDIYAVLYTGISATPTGGPIPASEDPSGIYLNALVIDGFPASAPNRTEYKFAGGERAILVSQADFENTAANWLHGEANQDLSPIPFANLNIVVTFNAPADLCIDAGVQAGLSGGSPNGGMYAGPGVTDDGNGMTYSFDPAAAGVGVHTLSYTSGGTTITDDIEVFAIDDASFNYSAAEYCAYDADPTPTITGLAGGSFTSGAGLSINAATGTIDVSASTPGTYTVTYTTSGTCPNSSSVSVTINAVDDASFNYSAAAYCSNGADPTPTITGLAGGAFSSGVGLSINASTGTIDVSASTPGTYTVTYTTSGTCPNSSSVSVTINTADDASFTYSAAAYCSNDADPTPTITGLAGGTFSSGAGLSINASTGTIDVSASTSGTYTVTYTTTGTCPNSSSVSVTINASPNVTFIAPTSPVCPGLVLTGQGGGTPIGGVYSGPGVTDDGNGMTYTFDTTVSGTGTHTLTYTFTAANGCTGSASDTVTVEDNEAPVAVCMDISVQLDANGMVTVTAPEVDGGSTDNCGGIASVEFLINNSPNATNSLILTLGNGADGESIAYNPVDGQMYHASGIVSGDQFFEPIDLGTLTVGANLAPGDTWPGGLTQEVTGMAYYPPLNGFVAMDRVGNIALIDPVTTNFSLLSTFEGTASFGYIRGFAVVGSTIYGVEPGNSQLVGFDPNTGLISSDVAVTIDGTEITAGSNGLTTNPVTGEVFIIFKDGPTRRMGTIDVTTGIGTEVGDTGINFSGISFDSSGNLYGISGDGATPSETLFQFDSTTVSVQDIDYTCSDVGDNTVTLLVTDDNGNTTTCTATITVEDNIPPIAVCQDITIQLDANGDASIVAADVDGGATDACGIASIAIDIDTFTCADVGTNNVILTVTDVNGNSSMCTSVVTVEDNIPPVAVCMDITVQLDATGNVVITGADINDGSTDVCGIASFTASPNSFTCADVGTNTVIVTVTDVNGNSSTCTAVVTVEDNVAPTAMCAAPFTIQLDAAGMASITVNDIENGSTDACGIASTSIDVTDFTCADVGVNIVTLTVTDVNGNISTCTTEVTVEDNVAPIAMCAAPFTIQLDANGMASITVNDIENGSTDACGIASTSIDVTDFTCADVGVNNVTLTVTDVNGNIATCTTDVTVEDNVAPIAMCAAPFTIQLDAAGMASITIADIENGSTDACGIASTSIDVTDFTCANVGPNTVTLTVADNNGNIATCTTIVTVEDTIDPVAVCMNITVQLDASGTASIVPADVDGGSSDACGIDTLSIDIDTFDCSNVGTNNVTLTVTDVNGNSSSCIAIVTVEDNIAPLMNCPADFTVGTDAEGMCGANVSFAAPIPIDTCGIDTVVQTAGLPSGSVFPVGASVIEYTATDVNGNTTTCSFTITVVDNDAPTAVCMDITIQLDAAGNATIVPADVDGGSTDNCAVDTLSIDVDTFTCADLGANNVLLTVTDTAGLTSTCTAIVTVEDITPPTVVCQDITVSLDATGTVTIDPSLLDGGSTDSCGAGIFTYSATPDTFTCAELGDNTVTLTVTDENGNSATCDAMVTVEDDTAPTIVCQDITVQLEENGMVTIVATDLIANADDACGVATTAVDIDTFTCDDLGTSVTVTVAATDASGNSTTCTAMVTVVDEFAPQFDTSSLPEDQVRVADESGEYILEDFTTDVIVTDNCSILDAAIVLGQDPAIGTVLTVGVYDITLSAEDDFGNLAEYVFELEVTKALSTGENSFDISSLTMYPNPATNYIILSNPQNIPLKEVTIYDVTGRLIKKIDASKTTSEVNIDVSELASATYMIIINTNAGQVNKQLVKE